MTSVLVRFWFFFDAVEYENNERWWWCRSSSVGDGENVKNAVVVFDDNVFKDIMCKKWWTFINTFICVWLRTTTWNTTKVVLPLVSSAPLLKSYLWFDVRYLVDQSIHSRWRKQKWNDAVTEQDFAFDVWEVCCVSRLSHGNNPGLRFLTNLKMGRRAELSSRQNYYSTAVLVRL